MDYSASSGQGGMTSGFPDPFADYSFFTAPRSINQAHRWGEALFNAEGIYSSALDRVLSYFITEVEPVGDEMGEDEKKKWRDAYDSIDIKTKVRLMSRDYLAYGIVLASYLAPFRRLLRCPTESCGQTYAFEYVMDNKKALRYRWQDLKFNLRCPKCEKEGAWDCEDVLDDDITRAVIRRWSPKEIDILHNRVTTRSKYIWKIPGDTRTQVKRGFDHVLEDTPKEIIDAVRDNANIKFEPSMLFVAIEESLSGIDMQGWGLARAVQNFRQALYVRVLSRINEAIAQDYIIPARLLSPVSGGDAAAQGDTSWLLNADSANFVSHMEAMVRTRRVDPASWFVSPIPIQYQIIGGEAKNLVPFELMEQGVSLLLNIIGVPVEFYKMSLTTQTFPPALRLLENVWSHLVHLQNKAVQWISDQIAMTRGWQRCEAKMAKVSIVDDLTSQSAILNLAAAREFSMGDALRRFIGADFADQQRKIVDEEAQRQEIQAKKQEELEQAAFSSQLAPTPMQQLQMGGQQDPAAAAAGGGQPGGAPTADAAAAQGQAMATPPSPMQPVSMNDMLQRAEYEAQRLLPLPYPQRRQELARIKQQNEALHKLTTETMDQMRGQMASQGKQQVMQQTYGVPG